MAHLVLQSVGFRDRSVFGPQCLALRFGIVHAANILYDSDYSNHFLVVVVAKCAGLGEFSEPSLLHGMSTHIGELVYLRQP